MSKAGKAWFKKFSANRKWAARISTSRKKKNHQAFDQHLKTNPTQAEIKVKSYLEELGVFFKFQKRFEAFVVDFYIPGDRIILEIDGPIHDFKQVYDSKRDDWFRYRKYRVIRINNASTETLKDFVVALRRIDRGLIEGWIRRSACYDSIVASWSEIACSSSVNG